MKHLNMLESFCLHKKPPNKEMVWGGLFYGAFISFVRVSVSRTSNLVSRMYEILFFFPLVPQSFRTRMSNCYTKHNFSVTYLSKPTGSSHVFFLITKLLLMVKCSP